jgi:hypothetical protein
MTPMQQTQRILRRLRIVRLVAFVDLVFLIILISAALAGKREFVHILGPLHGINFLLLLVIVGTAVLDGVWGWWFPIVILLTAGPPGAFLGEWLIHRRIKAQNLIAQEGADTSGTLLLVTGETSKDERKERL